MTDQEPPRPDVGISGTALVWAIAAMFMALLAAVVAIAIGVPESRNPSGLVAQLLAVFSTLLASIGILFSVQRVGRKVDQVATTAHELANGVGDAKFTAAVHRALDQRAQGQLMADDVTDPAT